jgi:hypothetical protein
MRGWFTSLFWLTGRRSGSSTVEHRSSPRAPQSIFARALPEKVKIVEKYFYARTISLNTHIEATEQPTGHIEVVVPYDGDKFFSREAIADVRSRLTDRSAAVTRTTLEALTGHLLLKFQEATTPDGQPLDERFKVIPLLVPIRSDTLRGMDDLAADTSDSQLRIEYSPKLSVDMPIPINIRVELADADTIQISDADDMEVRGGEVSRSVVRQASFSSELRLYLRIFLFVPRRPKKPRPKAEIKRVSLTWPTITSLSRTSLRLKLGSVAKELHYNPANHSLEWLAVPFANDDRDDPDTPAEAPEAKAKNPENSEKSENHNSPDDLDGQQGKGAEHSGADDRESANREWLRHLADPDRARWHWSARLPGNGKKPNGKESNDDKPDDEEPGSEAPDNEESNQEESEIAGHPVWEFSSKTMCLYVEQPGQLLNQEWLDGEVEVEIKDELLSGMQVALYDARGMAPRRNPVSMSSRVTVKFRLVLADAFERRSVSTTHTLQFDEIIPNEMRVDDIVAALRDRGFSVDVIKVPSNPEQLHSLLVANRIDGASTMTLLLDVLGRRHTTRRRAKASAVHRYSSEIDTGELQVTVRGQTERNTGMLTYEINELHQALSDRFRHVRAQR